MVVIPWCGWRIIALGDIPSRDVTVYNGGGGAVTSIAPSRSHEHSAFLKCIKYCTKTNLINHHTYLADFECSSTRSDKHGNYGTENTSSIAPKVLILLQTQYAE